MVMVMTICFPFSRPLCDLPRPHVRMLLYIQPKPSSSISHASDASSGFKHPTVEELPTECTMARTMAQSIAGPGQYCTKKVKCHPRSVSYPSRRSSASIRAPARLPRQPRLIQFWDRWSASRDLPSPRYFSSSKRKRHFSRIVTLSGLVPFEKNNGAASMIVNSG